MVIQYFGDGCFRLQSGETTLLIDSNNPRLKADVTLKTLTPTNILPQQGEILFPGEYEVKGIEITGLSVDSESTDKFLKTAYVVAWEEMRFAFLGHLSKIGDGEFVEELGEPDVLFIPVGGGHFISPTEAARFVKQVEPAIVIPSFAKNSHDFLKAIGQKAESQEKLVLKKKDLGTKKGAVVLLAPKS